MKWLIEFRLKFCKVNFYDKMFHLRLPLTRFPPFKITTKQPVQEDDHLDVSDNFPDHSPFHAAHSTPSITSKSNKRVAATSSRKATPIRLSPSTEHPNSSSRSIRYHFPLITTRRPWNLAHRVNF